MSRPQKVRWGVLGVASIAVRRAIPGMQKGEWCEVAAIASRDRRRAEEAAAKFGIVKAYGSYDELLADPEIEAVYNPLPNHLHVPWSIKAAEAGKHVLCEKPIGITAADARKLLTVRNRTGVKIGEAFMVRTHPRWLRAQALVRGGRIGQLRLVSGVFSYFNRDPANTRNIYDAGGGALLDLGCYAITLSRFLFAEEPARVFGAIERDRDTRTDVLTSAILKFPSGRATFTCSTQLAYFQTMYISGERGRMEIPASINPPADRPSEIIIGEQHGVVPGGTTVEEFPPVDQFTIQGDAFSKTIREDGEVPVPLEDSVKNMAVIEAVFRSAESSQWTSPDYALE
jgi:predicted dehydrogenase